MFVLKATVWLVLSTVISAGTSTAYKNYLDCSFESDCPLLIQDDQDEFDWKEGHSRVRELGNFAPSADATFGNESGWYLYTPSDTGRTRSSARLASVSLSVPVNTTVHVDFAYHMYDEQEVDRLGSLRVYVCKELEWSRSGNQGPSWIREQLNKTCPQTSFQVEFVGVLGGVHSDIGIDDISIGFYQEVMEVQEAIPTSTLAPTSINKSAVERPTCTIIEPKVWMMVAVVSIAVAGCLALFLILAGVHICKLRKQSPKVLKRHPPSDQTTSKHTPSTPSDSVTELDEQKVNHLEYCGMNAADGASKPKIPVRYSDMYLQPKATLLKERPGQCMRTHKLSWSNDAEDEDVYEAIGC
ncbi:uncharacterized protein [Asterias amurensis]|uniref:uncharacterized protein n=1 Tax=Asterias amurensis TaxID=7602 RepID=UPI003AB43B86